MLIEPMQEMFTRSTALILDFANIPKDMPVSFDIKNYFAECERREENPRQPANRQRFNDAALEESNSRYLIGRYGEDRVAMLADTAAGRDGRTIHMAIDIFCKDIEPVFAPISGEIVRSDYEEGFGEYGNYIILKPENSDYFIFFGHLSENKQGLGQVKKGQEIARLGDYHDCENGGWSRHLHLQVLRNLPLEGKTPDGYSTMENFASKSLIYPNPMGYFPGWHLK